MFLKHCASCRVEDRFYREKMGAEIPVRRLLQSSRRAMIQSHQRRGSVGGETVEPTRLLECSDARYEQKGGVETNYSFQPEHLEG